MLRIAKSSFWTVLGYVDQHVQVAFISMIVGMVTGMIISRFTTGELPHDGLVMTIGITSFISDMIAPALQKHYNQ